MKGVVRHSRGRKPFNALGWRQRSRVRSELNRRICRFLQTDDVDLRGANIEEEESVYEYSNDLTLDIEDDGMANNVSLGSSVLKCTSIDTDRHIDRYSTIDEIAIANHHSSHSVSLTSAIPELFSINTQSLVSETRNESDCSSSASDISDPSDEEFQDFSGEISTVTSFREKLATCFVENNISFTTGDSILKLLRTHECLAYLPKSTKTLLNTPRIPVVLSDVAPGKYLHLGFKVALSSILKGIPPDEIPSILEVDTSTDGAQIDNSGNNDIWPIQCRIANVKGGNTEVIGIYKGAKKPEDPEEFFRAFVDEANEVINDGGILFRGKKLTVVLRAFIADAPARAMMLNHMGHTSSNPCSKCDIVGVYSQRRMTLKGTNHRLRTDEDYSRKIDEDHHKEGHSALHRLPMGLVSQVPFEYMHLVLLGVMKRLFSAWISGKFSMKSKLSGYQIDMLSNRMEHLRQFCPQEFARYPRNIDKYSRYKATELRLFLLYIGPVVLHGILPDDIYQHFLLLHTSIRILASPCPSEQHFVYAKLALEIFLQECEPLYGESFISYNIHGLLHVVDDVKLLGPLDSYSAFPYENNMQIFRKYCKKPHLHLEQIARRRAERAQRISLREREICRKTEVLDKHSEGPLPKNASPLEFEQYKCVKSEKFILNLRKRDRSCILRDSSVCIIQNIVVRNTEILLVVDKFGVVDSFYNAAMPSTDVGYYACSALQKEHCLVKYDNSIKKGFIMNSWPLNNLSPADNEISENGKYVVVAMTGEVNY